MKITLRGTDNPPVSKLSNSQAGIRSVRERIRFYFSILMESRKSDNPDTPATIEVSAAESGITSPRSLEGALLNRHKALEFTV